MLTKLAITLLAVSFLSSVILTAVVKGLSKKVGFVCHPSEDRYHRTIIPLGGGIAVFITFAAAIISALFVVKFLVVRGRFDWLGESVTIHATGFLERLDEVFVVLLCISVLFVLGLLDDVKHLGPFVKLAVQFLVAAVAAWFADVRVEFFIHNRLITSILSAFWIVLIINAFNFLDNMDGASAGIAVIASAVLFVAAALSGQVFVGGLAVIFVGALLGFLVYNFPPAKIFMGDAGSLLVGFIVALLTLKTTYYHEAQSGQWYPVLLPLLVVAVPLYDFVSVMILRISQGKSPFVGDTQHFSHRLKRHGLTDTQAVLTLYLATLATSLGATFLYQVNLTGAILIVAQTFMVLMIIAVLESTAANDRNEG